jgi:hypothetical protein
MEVSGLELHVRLTVDAESGRETEEQDQKEV